MSPASSADAPATPPPRPFAATFAALGRVERERIILPLQRLRLFDGLSKALGIAVTGECILPLFACLYWCLDQHKCNAGIWLVPLNEIFNGCIKWLVRRGRPYWEDDRVLAHSFSSEFSFPSSHAQLAAALATFFVRASAHPQATTTTPALPAYAFALLVGWSRVHAGVHYPSDVAVGLGLGALSATAYDALLPSLLAMRAPSALRNLAMLSVRASEWRRAIPRNSPTRPAAAVRRRAPQVPALVCVAAIRRCYTLAMADDGSDPPEWKRNACRGRYASRELDPRRVPMGLYSGMVGVLAGLALGQAFYRHVPLALAASGRLAWLRALVGNAGLMAMFESIAALTPARPLWLYALMRFLKYVNVPVFILLIGPLLFRALQL